MITVDTLIKTQKSNYFRGFDGIDRSTPVSLVAEISVELSKSEDIIFSDPNRTFLFPAAGHGTFPIIFYWLLMEGLKKIIPDEKERGRHILIKMLYLNDINPTYCRWLKNHGFENVYCCDFLEFDIQMKFSCVIFNPPFQDPNNPNNKSKLWTSFTQKGLDLTESGGYTCQISPDTWTSPSRETNVREKLLTQFRRKNLILANFKSPNEHMKVGVNMSYVIIKNDNHYNGTTFITKKSSFKTEIPSEIFIPKIIEEKYLQVLSKLLSHDQKMVFKHYSSGVTSRVNFNQEQDETFLYPYFNTGGGDNNPAVLYGDTMDSKACFGERKIHTSGFGGYRIQLDNTGEYGTMHNGYCFLLNQIPATQEGVSSFFRLKVIRLLLEPNLWHQFVEPKILSLLPLVDLTKTWTDEEFNNLIGFSQELKKYINDFEL